MSTKKEGAHAQCMKNGYAKFKQLGMKTVGVGHYTKQTPT